MGRPTPYEKIRLAALRGTGTRLTAGDCEELYADDAIQVRADADAGGYHDRDGVYPEKEEVDGHHHDV